MVMQEMKLELMWINSVMKWRREGLGTPPVECLPVECGQSNGATGALHKKDRVSQSASDAGRACLVRLTHGDIGAGV